MNVSTRVDLVIILAGLLLVIGCGQKTAPSIAGVQGQVVINSTPAPVGTSVLFTLVNDDSETFATVVRAEGRYEYRPPAGVPVKQGEYRICVFPKQTETVMDAEGMTQSVDIPGAPKSYGKYSDTRKSDLKVELNTQNLTTFDIDIADKPL